MYGEIKIGSKTVGMLSNAASLYVYKNIFREDFLKKLQEEKPDEDLFQKMGFVMAKMAEVEKPSELMKMNIDSFYDWLADFDPLDVVLATEDISKLYLANKDGSSVPKNVGG